MWRLKLQLDLRDFFRRLDQELGQQEAIELAEKELEILRAEGDFPLETDIIEQSIDYSLALVERYIVKLESQHFCTEHLADKNKFIKYYKEVYAALEHAKDVKNQYKKELL